MIKYLLLLLVVGVMNTGCDNKKIVCNTSFVLNGVRTEIEDSNYYVRTSCDSIELIIWHGGSRDVYFGKITEVKRICEAKNIDTNNKLRME